MKQLTTAKRVVLSGFAALVLQTGWQEVVNGPKAEIQLRTLKKEFSGIVLEPGSVREENGDGTASKLSGSKPNVANINAIYQSRAPCGTIFSYYDHEFARNGWLFVRQQPSRSGTVRDYSKNKFDASLMCGGESTYTISLAWFGPYGGWRGGIVSLSIFFFVLALLAAVSAREGRSLGGTSTKVRPIAPREFPDCHG